MEGVLKLLQQIVTQLDGMSSQSPWLTLPQGAAYVHRKESLFRELVHSEEIPSHQISDRLTLVHKADLDAWVRDHPSASKVPEALRG